MNNRVTLRKLSTIIMVLLFFILSIPPVMATQTKTNQKIYDFAQLLTKEQIRELETLSHKYSAKRQVDIVILTTKDPQVTDVETFMEDFYDEKGLGYDKAHGNTAILTVDMTNREVYVAGFYKGEKYLDNKRCELIRTKITPYLSEEDYYKAFNSFIELSYKYMGIRPGINPDNILFNLGFQILVSFILAGVVVTIMAYNSAGKITTGQSTYLDASDSEVTERRDIYIKTDITKVRKPSNNNRGSGGGTSRGGHSHSGSRGSF